MVHGCHGHLARVVAASRKKTPDPVAQETVDWTGLRQLGEYRLIEKLGAGGMGEVYKAVYTEMDRVVAVKVLAPGRPGELAHRRLVGG